MPYPAKVKQHADILKKLRAVGYTLNEIASIFAVNESSIREIIGKTGRVREGNARPLAERFWQKVSASTETACWEWRGACGGSGYGHIIHGGQIIDAHRISYQLNRGPISDEMFVLHSCDNKKCVNPAHLYLGTQHDNMVDFHRRKTSHNGKLSQDNIVAIMYLCGEGYMSQRQIGQLFGIGQSQVSAIWRRKRYKCFTDGYAVGHPEITQFRKEGEPSVSIRTVGQ